MFSLYVSINVAFISSFVITAGAIIFDTFMNICYTLSHVRLTQGFVITLLTIQIIRRATCSNNTACSTYWKHQFLFS